MENQVACLRYKRDKKIRCCGCHSINETWYEVTVSTYKGHTLRSVSIEQYCEQCLRKQPGELRNVGDHACHYYHRMGMSYDGHGFSTFDLFMVYEVTWSSSHVNS